MGVRVGQVISNTSNRLGWKRPPASVAVAAGRRAANLRQRQLVIAALVTSDALMAGLALLVAGQLSQRIGGNGVVASPGTYLPAVGVAVYVLLAIFAVAGLYRYHLVLAGLREYVAVLQACSYGTIAFLVIGLSGTAFPISRTWLLSAWGLSIVFVGGARFAWRRILAGLRRARGWLVVPTIVVGANEHGRVIARQLAVDGAGTQIVGFVDDFLPVGTPVLDGVAVLGTPHQIHDLAARHAVEQVIVLPNAVAWETFREIIEDASRPNGYVVHVSPGYYEILPTGVEVVHKGFVPLLRVEPGRITGIDRVLRLALDYGLGAMLALLTAPLTIGIALAIRLIDRQPILDRPVVLGLHGKPFRTLKFRTGVGCSGRRRMVAPIPADVLNDPCVSRLGRFLYRTGLDKLPQLFDVLRGRMSLVGPRSIPEAQAQAYTAWLPNLLVVRPGWTGPWAVGDAETLEDEVELTLHYVRNWTIWMDLRVLLQMARRLLLGKERGGR